MLCYLVVYYFDVVVDFVWFLKEGINLIVEYDYILVLVDLILLDVMNGEVVKYMFLKNILIVVLIFKIDEYIC